MPLEFWWPTAFGHSLDWRIRRCNLIFPLGQEPQTLPHCYQLGLNGNARKLFFVVKFFTIKHIWQYNHANGHKMMVPTKRLWNLLAIWISFFCQCSSTSPTVWKEPTTNTTSSSPFADANAASNAATGFVCCSTPWGRLWQSSAAVAARGPCREAGYQCCNGANTSNICWNVFVTWSMKLQRASSCPHIFSNLLCKVFCWMWVMSHIRAQSQAGHFNLLHAPEAERSSNH